MMPTKKNPETQKEQSKRFKRDARSLIDAGELIPTDAEEALDNLVKKARGQAKSGTS